MLTVITSTIGRESLFKLSESLSKQNVKIYHIILWDTKRENDGIEPYDKKISNLVNDNYEVYHYIINHPIFLEENERIDNHMRLIGLTMTTSKFFTFIDDDCWVEDKWCKTAIENIQHKNSNFCYCYRYIWDSDYNKIGLDNYESIGMKNNFGYHLIDMNTIIYNKSMKDLITAILSNYNQYEIDRIIAEIILTKNSGVQLKEGFLNQISPDFLLDFHKKNIFFQNYINTN